MSTVKRLFYGGVAIAGFVFALQLLAESTTALGPVLETVLRMVIRGDVSALGAGWIGALLLLNGASVMAIGLSFLTAGVVDAAEYFMLMGGARLGAAFMVVFLGIIEYVRGDNASLRDATSIGVLSFLTTYLVYIPAIITGYIVLQYYPIDAGIAGVHVPQVSLITFFNTAAVTVMDVLDSAFFGFGMAVIVLFLSLHVFDKAFAGLGADTFRSKYFRFMMNQRWVGFGAGLLVTAVTTSVSISLGLLVPLHSQGYLKREELIPYIMGANVATMSGTIIAAVVLDTAVGMSIVLYFTALITGFTLVSMVFYDQFFTVLKWLFDRIMTNATLFHGFLASLAGIPLLMILL